jgi:hypothetical protein
MKSLAVLASLAAALAAETDTGNSCTEWNLVNIGHQLDPLMQPSPVGIYRVTNARTIAASTLNLYILDHTGRDTRNLNYGQTHYHDYTWNTRATTEADYTKCSTDGGAWKSTWDLSFKEPGMVGKHHSTTGSCGGWILLQAMIDAAAQLTRAFCKPLLEQLPQARWTTPTHAWPRPRLPPPLPPLLPLPLHAQSPHRPMPPLARHCGCIRAQGPPSPSSSSRTA